MAVNLLSHDIADLCLGKPAIRSVPASTTIGDALAALKKSGEAFLSVWSCDHEGKRKGEELADPCLCVGKVSTVDVVVYLCKEENLHDPPAALKAPVSVLLPEVAGAVRHVEPHCSLLEAIDLILEGAQNLVVPIQTRRRKAQKSGQSGHAGGREYCWITPEDIVRFLLNCIGLFSPIPALSVDSLGIIRSEVLAVGYHDPAFSAVDYIALAHSDQTSVAVVAPDGTLIGEISPATVAACGEAAAPAIAALSAGDLMAYIDCGGPPSHLVWAVKARLREQGLEGMLELLGDCSFSSSSSSSDEESPAPQSSLSSPTGRLRPRRSSSYSARMARRAEAIVCQKGSSLVAVMIQALAHRVNYVWVLDDDYGLVGIVTFFDILRVFRDHFQD